MSGDVLLETDVDPDPWRRVEHCTCAGPSIGPGPCEPSCGWTDEPEVAK